MYVQGTTECFVPPVSERAETPFARALYSSVAAGALRLYCLVGLRYSYFDTRIVRRSNMLLADMGGKPYGKSLNFLQFSVLPADACWHCQAKEERPPEG